MPLMASRPCPLTYVPADTPKRLCSPGNYAYNAAFFLIRSSGSPAADTDPGNTGLDMPIYEYQCEACRHELEAIQKLSDAPLVECPSCGKSSLKKRISAVAFRLKGGGWYETDFKTGDKKNIAGDSGESGKSDSKPDSKSESKSDSSSSSANSGSNSSSNTSSSTAASA